MAQGIVFQDAQGHSTPIQRIDHPLSNVIPADTNLITGKLPNGLTYIILPNNKPEGKAELRLVVNAGSVLEDDDQQGLAHFMEHMNFNGLKHFPHNEVIHYLQSIGVKFGADLNAYTSFDETVFILPVPSDKKGKLDSAFTILADWANNALVDTKEMDAERSVILEESRLGKGAEDRMFNKWFPRILKGSKYSLRLPIGKDSIVKSAPRKSLLRYYKDWYRPDLECVIVVGDINPTEVKQLITKKFGGFTNPIPERQRLQVTDLPRQDLSAAVVTADPESYYTQVQVLGPLNKHTEDVTQEEYRHTVMSGMYTEMLNQRLSEIARGPNPPFAYAGSSFHSGWIRGWESFSLYAFCSLSKLKTAVQTIVQETMRAKKFGFLPAELERTKAGMLSGAEQLYNERDKTPSSQLVPELIRHYLTGEKVPGITWEYTYQKAFVPPITLNEINQFGKEIQIDSLFTALLMSRPDSTLPTESTLKAWIDEALEMTVAPYAEKVLPTQLLEPNQEPSPGKVLRTVRNEKLGITTYYLSNGSTVTLKPTDFKNDEILLQGSRYGGSSLYPGSDYQSSSNADGIVEQMGYGAFTSGDLSKYLADKQVNVTLDIGHYTENIFGYASKKELKTMFQLLYLKCMAPRNDESGCRSFIDKEKQMSEDMGRDPQNVFYDSLNFIRSHGNPLARFLHAPTYYEQIDHDHSLDFYSSRMGNAYGMHYVLVGNFDEAAINPLVCTYIGGMPGVITDTLFRDLHLEQGRGQLKLDMQRGEDPKAMLYATITGSAKLSPAAYIKADVLSEIINNEIVDTLREKMGAIYSGRFNLSLSAIPTPSYQVTAELPCGPENLDKVEAVYYRILAEATVPGNFTTLALKKAQKAALDKFRTGEKSNMFWLSQLSKSQLGHYDPSFLHAYETLINAITVDDLTNLAKYYFNGEVTFKGRLLPVRR